jgi:hypothetical protein
MFIVVE